MAQLLHADSAKAHICLSNTPDSLISFDLIESDNCWWYGHMDNSRLLGLKSYATALLKITCTGADSNSIKASRDAVIVCLPKVDVKGMRWPSDTTWLDTVFINHDSMKVAGDVPVFLVIQDDSTGKEINLKEKIDSVGYRYRSFWIANSNYNDSLFERIYRRDSTYVRWGNAFPNNLKTCLVKLNHDSLYAIGGKLTIEARGALAHVANINNLFKVNSDSITPQGDTIRHYILIDSDPSNDEFSSILATNKIRAVAWQEYAGSVDRVAHCDNPTGVFNPQWNNYWDIRIYAGDTCRDSLTPCENTGSTASGIMQIVRSQWDSLFLGLKRGQPAGYDTAKWDSIEWNWKICIRNGTYIFDIYYLSKINKNAIQSKFPDSCSLADCDTFPEHKNKEDLKAYGYYRGEYQMGLIRTDDDWKNYIAVKNSPPLYAQYVQKVRKYYYRRPWQ